MTASDFAASVAGGTGTSPASALATRATPVVLRGVVRDWPAVRAGAQSPESLVRYLQRFDRGKPVDAIMTRPEEEGRVFYDAAMNGFNFLRNQLPIGAVAGQVLRYAHVGDKSAGVAAPAAAAQSAPIAECLPGFEVENAIAFLPPAVKPRIWLGNAITTPTHLDEWNNLGCVVAGRRRFTLFPPEQVANLYIGPLDFAPTGAPMSLVRLHDPDFVRFPRFRDALNAAIVAELEPGDAIFIPALWWHHVESLESFNLLVNYWWHALPGSAVGESSGFDALIHALISIRGLPAETRAAWQSLFEHYVFTVDDTTTAHIPAHRLGLLGDLAPADAARLRAALAEKLRRRE